MPPPRTLPNPEQCSKEELEIALSCTPTKQVYARLLAIKQLILGIPFDIICQSYSVCQRTLQRWIAAWNVAGVDGLTTAERPGRPRLLEPSERSSLHDLLNNPRKVGHNHWTGRKFHGYLRDHLATDVSYRTVIRFFHEEGFRLKVPQPWPDRQDEGKRRAFRSHLKELCKDDTIELWFQDESGFEGDPRPRRRWIERGQKGRVTKNGDHLRMNACGMVCPRTGEFFVLQFSHSDKDCFQVFLEEANKDLPLTRKRQILIMDNASWHKSKSHEWGRFEPLYLPPYSPDLNPIERLWLVIKNEWFNGFVAKTRQDLIDHLNKKPSAGLLIEAR